MMKHIEVAANLVEHRHDPREVFQLAESALADPDLTHTDTITLIATLVTVIHDAGQRSSRVDTMLDLFAAIPDAMTERGAKFVMYPAADITDPTKLRTLFDGAIEGTVRADRVWIVRPLPGNLYAVALEGSQTPKRTIGVVGGTQEDATQLRNALNRLDGR